MGFALLTLRTKTCSGYPRNNDINTPYGSKSSSVVTCEQFASIQ